MKTTFGRKSLLAIKNREFVAERVINGVVLISGKGLSRDRRYLRGRSQPRRAAPHGTGLALWGSSRETQTLQSSWYLPDDGASFELVDDRTGNVAVISATSEAGDVQDSS